MAYPSISNYVAQDATRAFKAAPNTATGLGAATREAVVGPLSYGMGELAGMIKPVANAVADFGRGVVSGQPADTAVTNPAPMAPLVPANTAALTLPATPATMNFEPTATSATPMISAAARNAQLQRAYAPTVYNAEASSTPSLQPMPAADPNAAIMASANDGTWSGMINANKMAKRLDATRAAQVAQTQAATGQVNAVTGQQNADSARITALTGAQTGAAQAGLIGENIKAAMTAGESGKLDLASKQEETTLRKAAAAGDEKAIIKLRNLMAARQGKAPEEAMNEKLLETYIKSVGEFNKDPGNMGKPAPSFQDFISALPPEMFPNVAKAAKTNITNDPRAAAIKANTKLSIEDKTKQLQALGYK